MNPIKLKEYENYRKVQKDNKKEFQWHEFLKLDKAQYLNFRVSIYDDLMTICEFYIITMLQNDLRNRAASRFSRGEALTRQPKGKVKEVINEVRVQNSY